MHAVRWQAFSSTTKWLHKLNSTFRLHCSQYPTASFCGFFILHRLKAQVSKAVTFLIQNQSLMARNQKGANKSTVHVCTVCMCFVFGTEVVEGSHTHSQAELWAVQAWCMTSSWPHWHCALFASVAEGLEWAPSPLGTEGKERLTPMFHWPPTHTDP